MKSKWAKYNAEFFHTGNDTSKPIVEPVGLELMKMYWKGKTGMTGKAIVDDKTARDKDQSDDDESDKQDRTKKRKTMGDSLEIGLKSMSEGLVALASAFTPPPASDSTGIIQVLERQKIQIDRLVESQSYQTQQIGKLLEYLIQREN